MKRTFKNVSFITGVLMGLSMMKGQVGIGNSVPRGALDINKKEGNSYSYDMGLVLPTNDAAAKIKNAIPNASVAPGTIFYDSAKDCVRLKQVADWSDCIGNAETTPLGVVDALICDNPVISGTFAAGVYTYGSVTISYINGNGKSYPAYSIGSTGITGLTATITPGNFETGNGTLTFVVTGIPSAEGTAVFPIHIGGQSCYVSIPVVKKPGGSGSGSDFVRLAVVGGDHILYQSAGSDWGQNRFANQLRSSANYGPSGIKKDGDIFYTVISSNTPYDVFSMSQGISLATQVRQKVTGKKLKASFDILEISQWNLASHITSPNMIEPQDFNTISEFVKEGGVAIIGIMNNHYHNYLMGNFGMTEYNNSNVFKGFGGYTARARITANFPGSDQNFGSVAIGGEFEGAKDMSTGYNFGYKIDRLPAGSKVYAVNQYNPDYATIWTLGGEYNGRVIFVNYGYFKNYSTLGGDQDLVIDAPYEKFMHNLVAYAMDKSKGKEYP